jgi:7-cyano-7-deazaguanine synthase
MTEIFREYTFEAAHYLPHVPEGHKCAQLHGHSYHVTLGVIGPVDAAAGWVMDFGDISHAWKPLHNRLDHKLLNNIEGLHNPTSEMLAEWIWTQLHTVIPHLAYVRVQETQTSGAIYRTPTNITTRRASAHQSTEGKAAVVLLSGGLDSATALAIAKRDGFEPYALSFRYGQRHEVELDRARQVAEAGGVARHVIADIDLRVFGGSALTGAIDVPKHDSVDELGSGIPATYVPARNTIFLSFALAYAETIGASDIFIGVNALDYSGYPDCRPEYIEAYEVMARLATRAGVEGQELTIHTPLMRMTKAEIIETGLSLGVDYSLTSSCYDPDDQARGCGHCDSCLLRLKGFTEAGGTDPIEYQG